MSQISGILGDQTINRCVQDSINAAMQQVNNMNGPSNQENVIIVNDSGTSITTEGESTESEESTGTEEEYEDEEVIQNQVDTSETRTNTIESDHGQNEIEYNQNNNNNQNIESEFAGM